MAASAYKRRIESDVLVYRTAVGVFDFHAFRHFYVTMVGRSGAGVKETQTLARHSTPLLTFGTYSTTEAAKLAAVVEQAFPSPLERTPHAIVPALFEPTKGGSEETQAHRSKVKGW